MRISILGVDYRSAIFAACLCYRGHRVIGVDFEQSRADWFNQGQPPSFDPGLDVLLESGRHAGLLSGTTDLAAAVAQTEVTFLDSQTLPRLAAQQRLFREIGLALRRKPTPHLLLIRSAASRESLLPELLPVLEDSSGKRLGEGFELEVSADYSAKPPAFCCSEPASLACSGHLGEDCAIRKSSGDRAG